MLHVTALLFSVLIPHTDDVAIVRRWFTAILARIANAFRPAPFVPYSAAGYGFPHVLLHTAEEREATALARAAASCVPPAPVVCQAAPVLSCILTEAPAPIATPPAVEAPAQIVRKPRRSKDNGTITMAANSPVDAPAIPFAIGARVRIDGDVGTVTGFRGRDALVIFDGEDVARVFHWTMLTPVRYDETGHEIGWKTW